ncbi:hypothetical protein HPB48_000082 [Haemaphysalis longicornis]|uniref:Uncharacterized protein n=1 Tax=Haemaphysalis longicornis TaxID=44386 RepID=A0A9J6G058_HAELO|nr:hypothetical protein HPB48_000082 [Haemaphysalis longicornis]
MWFFTHTINAETVQIFRDRPKLTDNAIPTVYTNVPAYLSKKPPQKRTPRTSAGGLPGKIPRCEGSASVHDNGADSYEDRSSSNNSPTAPDIASCEPPSAYWAKHRIAGAANVTAFTVCAMNDGNLAFEKVVLFTANECSIQAKVSVQATLVKNVQVSNTAMAQELLAEVDSLIPCKGFGKKGEFAANLKRQEKTCGGRTFSTSCPGVAQEPGKACPQCRYLRKLMLDQASYKRRKAHACTRPLSYKLLCGTTSYETPRKLGYRLPSNRTLTWCLHRLEFMPGILTEVVNLLKLSAESWKMCKSTVPCF